MTKDDGVVLGIIPARGGSRRIPRKNIRPLGGNKPLIAWTIEQAKLAKSLDYFLVSTGDPEIAEISRQYGAPVPFRRPKKLCEDIDSIFVLQHAVDWFEKKKKKHVEHIVCLQPTSPFRNHHDIDSCVHLAKEKKADTIVSVVKVSQHPYWMFETDVFGRLRSFMDMRLEGKILVSQNLPLFWFPNGAVYVTARQTLDQGKIFGEKMFPFQMPENRSIDLEVENDFMVASAMVQFYGNDFHVKTRPRLVVGCE